MDRPRTTIGEKADRVASVLKAEGCEQPREDSEALVAHALGLSASDVERKRGDPLPPAADTYLTETVARRARREPLAYILRECSFRGLELYVDARVLIPEEDSGPLVDVALAMPANGRIHDVGTGSGAIALAIKAERPDLIVSGSDVSPEAIEVACINAERLAIDVKFWTARGLPEGRFDLVVANMPFQDRTAQTVPTTPEYTEYQPDVAVFAGPTGLEVIEEILAELKPGSRIALKHAISQRQAIHGRLADAHVVSSDQVAMQFTVGLGKDHRERPKAPRAEGNRPGGRRDPHLDA